MLYYTTYIINLKKTVIKAKKIKNKAALNAMIPKLKVNRS